MLSRDQHHDGLEDAGSQRRPQQFVRLVGYQRDDGEGQQPDPEQQRDMVVGVEAMV